MQHGSESVESKHINQVKKKSNNAASSMFSEHSASPYTLSIFSNLITIHMFQS